MQKVPREISAVVLGAIREDGALIIIEVDYEIRWLPYYFDD